MIIQYKTLICFFILLLLSFACPCLANNKNETEAFAQEVSTNRKNRLVIGRVSDNPKKHYKRVKAIVDYAATKLKDFGITEGAVLLCKNNEEVIKYLNEGKIDWVTETPFSAIIYANNCDVEIALRRWKKGVAEYKCVFFAQNESKIKSLDDLKGKKIAFEDQGSTSAYFWPKLILMETGFDLIELHSPKQAFSNDKTGYLFAGGELNISAWVYKGLADAGAFSNLDWDDIDDTPYAYKENLKLIYQSKPFPRAVELFSNRMKPELKNRIKEILLNAHNDPEAKEALTIYSKTTKFDKITEDIKTKLKEMEFLIKKHMPKEFQ